MRHPEFLVNEGGQPTLIDFGGYHFIEDLNQTPEWINYYCNAHKWNLALMGHRTRLYSGNRFTRLVTPTKFGMDFLKRPG